MTRTRQTKIRIRRDAVMNATGMESRRPGGYRPRTVNGRGQVLDLTWNLQGELVSVSTNGVFAEGYAYDALGRRVSTTDASGTVYHAYDGIHCVADLAADGALLRSYTWGSGIDNLLAVTLYSATETNTLYAVTDPLGTVHALVGTNGVPAATYAYDSWGNFLSASGGESLVPSLRFTWQGREYSRATGLYHFRARWYDPAAGRWLSKDPIGLEGGLNLYEAFGNNPMCFRDPRGCDRYLGFEAYHAYILIDCWVKTEEGYVKDGYYRAELLPYPFPKLKQFAKMFIGQAEGRIVVRQIPADSVDLKKTVEMFHVRSSTEEDIDAILMIRCDQKFGLKYSLFLDNCIHWALGALIYGL